MQTMAQKLAAYCEDHFDLSLQHTQHYRSLSICIIDCVYSLRAKYEKVTLPIVQRYADAYMNGNRYADGDTISELIAHIEDVGGPQAFADNIIRNHQKLGGGLIPKENAVFQMARFLKLLQIETLDDFQNYEAPDLVEAVIRAVKGISDAGVNYLFMLAGDPNRVKPDVHIHHCVVDACGKDVSNDTCQILFTEAVRILQEKHPQLTVRALDGIVWQAYSKTRLAAN